MPNICQLRADVNFNTAESVSEVLLKASDFFKAINMETHLISVEGLTVSVEGETRWSCPKKLARDFFAWFDRIEPIETINAVLCFSECSGMLYGKYTLTNGELTLQQVPTEYFPILPSDLFDAGCYYDYLDYLRDSQPKTKVGNIKKFLVNIMKAKNKGKDK